MRTFKINAYSLLLFKSMLKLLNFVNKLWLYNIFFGGTAKAIPPKIYSFIHKT